MEWLSVEMVSKAESINNSNPSLAFYAHELLNESIKNTTFESI